MIPSRRPRAAAVVAAATAAVLGLGLAGGVALAPLVTGTAAETRPGAVDVGFSQDMIVHHEQAVVMAQLVRGRTADPTVAAVAAGIEGDQLIEIGQLRGFLVLWDAPALPSGPPMTWMAPGAGGHAGHGPETAPAAPAAMPGMATLDELDALRRATGAGLDVLFLQLMLRHHDGGMPMLADAAERAAVPAVRNLARKMAFDQTEETATVRQLLAARAAAPPS